jgi:hypothetical protein
VFQLSTLGYLLSIRAGNPYRRNFFRIERLACVLALVLGLMAVVSPVASAQMTATNPTLKVRCGLKVMLVLDESASIPDFGATDDVREAATGFVKALLGTGSPLAITAFESRGRPGPPELTTGIGYAEVTAGNVGTFTEWIQNENQPPGVGYNPVNNVTLSPLRGTTNWEDAFHQVGRTRNGPPNLVVFVTDGDPNTFNNAAGNPVFQAGATGTLNATNAAVDASNTVKADGSRVFAIGVGSAVDNPESAARLQRVSGTNQGTDPITADYTLVTNFPDLRAELSHIVARLCGSSLIITKYASDAHGGPWRKAPGWKFTATLNTPHTWLEPNAGTSHSAMLTTDKDGEAAFHWRLPTAQTTAALGATKETVKPGFHFVLAQCQTHRANGTFTEHESTTKIPEATLGREEYHTCQVYNAPPKPGGGGGEVTGTPGGPCIDCGKEVAAPHLSVSKRMPAHAQVGDRVPITITVENVGGEMAHGTRLHETPPHGTQIVAVGNHGSIKPNGAVIWDLGDLAPGKSRVVHATMLVVRPGLHLNTAVASASDSYPAFDGAQERAGRRARPPSFTG